MDRSELQSLSTGVYGRHWMSALARDFGVNARTVQRWAKSGVANDETARRLRDYLENRRRSIVDGPDNNSDPNAYDKFEPGVDAFIDSAVAAGWSRRMAAIGTILAAGHQLAGVVGEDEAQEIMKSLACVFDSRKFVGGPKLTPEQIDSFNAALDEIKKNPA